MLDVWTMSLQEGSSLFGVYVCVKASVFVTFISIDVRLAEARVFTVVFGDCDSLTASHFSAFGLTFLNSRASYTSLLRHTLTHWFSVRFLEVAK